MACYKPKGLEDRVMERRANLADLVIGTGGVHAVREEDDEELALGVDPQR